MYIRVLILVLMMTISLPIFKCSSSQDIDTKNKFNNMLSQLYESLCKEILEFDTNFDSILAKKKFYDCGMLDTKNNRDDLSLCMINLHENGLLLLNSSDFHKLETYFHNLTTTYWVKYNANVNGVLMSKLSKYRNMLSLQNCEYKRDSIIECFETYFDLNGNKIVEVNEIHDAINKYTSFWLRLITFITQPIPKILSRCDMDGDGKISRDDYDKSTLTCMETCNSLRDAHKYLCDKAKNQSIKNKIK